MAGITVSVRIFCVRSSPLIVVLTGASLAMTGIGISGFGLDSRRSEPAIPVESIESIRGVVATDCHIDGEGTYALSVRPIYFKNRHGDECTGTTAPPLLVYARLDSSLLRGAIIEISGAVGVRTGESWYLITDQTRPTTTGWISSVAGLRAMLFRRIDDLRCRLAHPSSALFGALLLGLDDRSLDDTRYFMRMCGSIHIFALSGMHVGVLIGLLSSVLTPIFGRRIGRLVSIPFIAAYVYLIGSPPALLRAGTMFCIASLFSQRESRIIDILSISFLVSVFAQPETVHTLSFRLTYLAVAGILGFSRFFTSWFRSYLPRTIAAGVGVSTAAFVSTSWLIISEFGVAYPVGIIASIVLGPLVTFFLSFGVITIALDAVLSQLPIRYSLHFFYVVLDRAGAGIDATARFFSRFPPVSVSPIVFCLVILVVIVHLNRRFRYRAKLQFSARNHSVSQRSRPSS